MSYEFRTVESLIDGVKGTTGLLSSLMSRKSALAFILLVLSVIFSKVLLG